MDNQWATQTVRILATLVGMVPVCARLINLLSINYNAYQVQVINYLEVVGESAIWRDGAMRYACCAVHLGRTILVNTVEMKARRLVLQTVLDIDDHAIAYVGGNWRYGPLTVDANSLAWEDAIRVCDDPTDVEIVGYGSSIDDSTVDYSGSCQTSIDGREHLARDRMSYSCGGHLLSGEPAIL